jgi:hypothetical protein
MKIVAAIALFTIGFVDILPAVAGEGSADIGRPPPYGYYANERGPALSGYGATDTLSGRTTRPVRWR